MDEEAKRKIQVCLEALRQDQATQARFIARFARLQRSARGSGAKADKGVAQDLAALETLYGQWQASRDEATRACQAFGEYIS